MAREVSVASGSSVKYAAAVRGFPKNYKIDSYEVESLVNNQPFTMDEITRGARNRIDAVIMNFNHINDSSLVLAMENGIIHSELTNKYLDIGYVLLHDMQSGKRYEAYTGTVTLPTNLFKMSEKSGFKLTVGELMNLVDQQINDDDPHSFLSSYSREERLGIAVSTVFYELAADERSLV